MQLVTALRAFFATLFHRATADAVRALLDGRATSAEGAAPAGSWPPPPPPPPPQAAQPPAAARSEALTLLAALQREARFVDLVQEPLASYADAQVGAAARDVLRDCQKVLDRFFGLQPISSVTDGETCELPADFDPQKFRLRGSMPPGGAAVTGTVVHPGWQATRCELPGWSGSRQAAWVIAPAELELPAK